MQTVARFVVRWRKAILALFILLTIASICAIPRVVVNHDMTLYLPDTLQAKQGLTLMNEEFGSQTTFRIMFAGLSDEERLEMADRLAALEGVTEVDYELEDEAYNSGDYALYEVDCEGGTYSDEAGAVDETIQEFLESCGYEYYIDSPVSDADISYLVPILFCAFLFGVLILFIMSKSWFEPVLLIITILCAVAINMGTNAFFPSISDVSYSISAVLQMALSMDYSIMLMSRYRLERTQTDDCELAMERAIDRGFRAIASSSVTTIVGLLTLILMTFTIGRDLGLVLAKGVLLSLVCELAIMPALVIWSDKLIRKTPKRAPAPAFAKLAELSARRHTEILVVSLCVVGLAFGVKTMMSASYHVAPHSEDPGIINAVFPEESQLLIVYESADEDLVADTISRIADFEGISSVTSNATTLGAEYSASDIAEALEGYDDIELDLDTINLAYYFYFNPDELESLTTVSLLRLSRTVSSLVDPDWSVSLYDLLLFLRDDLLTNDVIAAQLDEEESASVDDVAAQLESAYARLVGDTYARAILMTPYESETEEIDALLERIESAMDETGSTYYLVGDASLARDMSKSFLGEFNSISWVTAIAIYLIVAITFRSILLPLPLVLVIQSAYGLATGLNGLFNNPIYYMALIVVQAILMGATIDYAILLTSNYRDARRTYGVNEAIKLAYKMSTPTILTSGAILALVTLAIGLFGDGTVAQICKILSEGCMLAVLLVMVILPGTEVALDRFFAPKGSVAKDYVSQ